MHAEAYTISRLEALAGIVRGIIVTIVFFLDDTVFND